MNEREIGHIVVNERYVKTSVSNEGEKAFSILNSMVNAQAFGTQVVGELRPDAVDQRGCVQIGTFTSAAFCVFCASQRTERKKELLLMQFLTTIDIIDD